MIQSQPLTYTLDQTNHKKGSDKFVPLLWHPVAFPFSTTLMDIFINSIKGSTFSRNLNTATDISVVHSRRCITLHPKDPSFTVCMDYGFRNALDRAPL